MLPPNVSEAQFERALAAWGGIVGAPNMVSSSAAELAAYRDPFAPGQAVFEASAALRPASVDEIRAILHVANQYRIPLWTVSTGRNFAYGGAAPRLPGSVVLDLQRMNRIIEVNETLAYALVEPGVSYFDLDAYLRSNGLKLWVDPPAAGWGSVIGNTLERGFGYTPYGDHAAHQCGLEVVLANGDVVRTGMGAIDIGTLWYATLAPRLAAVPVSLIGFARASDYFVLGRLAAGPNRRVVEQAGEPGAGLGSPVAFLIGPAIARPLNGPLNGPAPARTCTPDSSDQTPCRRRTSV